MAPGIDQNREREGSDALPNCFDSEKVCRAWVGVKGCPTCMQVLARTDEDIRLLLQCQNVRLAQRAPVKLNIGIKPSPRGDTKS